MYILLLAAMLFWGFSFVWYKMAYQHFLPLTVVFFRLFLSSTFLFLLAATMRKLQHVSQKDLPLLFLIALFEPFLYFIGESLGMQYVSSTLASIIIATIPLFTPVAAYFFFKERISVLNIAGIIVSLAGVLIVVDANTSSGNSSLPGILLIFLAVFSAVGYSLMVKRLTERFNPFTIVAWQNGMGAILFLPLFLLFEFPRLDVSSITWKNMLPVIYLTFFASVLAFIFFVNAVASIGASKANIFTNAIPVFTALFSWLLLGEQLSLMKLTGMFIVMAGIFMSQLSHGRISRFLMVFRSQE